MKEPITFAIAGFGDRGSTYASMSQIFPERMKITAVADLRPERVRKAKTLYGLSDAQCFSSAEEMLKQEKLADVMIVSTMDRQHVGHAMPAIEKGYHVLLEKPISPELSECERIREAAKKHGAKVIVCHVLRYTPFYNAIRDIICKGIVGEIVSVNASENVGYWHQAHSFVRGNWRNSEETSPMILQKSCHDMDIFLWLTGKTCASVSSYGGNYLFRSERAPKGSTAYCLEGCKAKADCIFDAERIYINDAKTGVISGDSWMSSVVSAEHTVESTYQALKDGPYGRCVYACDNNVVDHQQVNMHMTDGSTISFSMCAFSQDCYREIKIMGTKGELKADTKQNKIHVREFGKEEEVIDIMRFTSDLKGHGGGDSGIISDLLDLLSDDGEMNERTTTLDRSIESHYLAMAAEKSRINNGHPVEIAELKGTIHG